VRIEAQTKGATTTITNAFGLEILAPTIGTNNYSLHPFGNILLENNQFIYQKNAASAVKNLISFSSGNNVQIGDTGGGYTAYYSSGGHYFNTNNGSADSFRWTILGPGNLKPYADATYSIGSQALRVLNARLSGTVSTGAVSWINGVEGGCIAVTNAVVDGALNTKITSASYNFVVADIGASVIVTAGTGWTVGTYPIVSVSANAATLEASPAAVGTTGGSLTVGRGRVLMVQGAAGVADTLRVCAKSSLNAYSWIPMAVIP